MELMDGVLYFFCVIMALVFLSLSADEDKTYFNLSTTHAPS